MNFYLDFEATRFSKRIISIGCVAGNGATFETLVKPVNKAKVDQFITELTGITNEMLATAPSADEAFNQLFDFIELNNTDGTCPKYYVYGNSDVEFVEHTVKYMTDARACMCAQALQGTMIDYATTEKRFFNVKSDFALRKIYMLIKSVQDMEQEHDALKDALMLQTVAENLYDKCKPADKTILATMVTPKKPSLNGTKATAPAIFTGWNLYKKWDAPTNADENNWVIKAIDQHRGADCPVYFDNLDTAALWIIKYVSRQLSPKKPEHIERVKAAITKSNVDGKCRYNCYWTIKKGE